MLGQIEAIAQQTGAAILVVHHAPKGNLASRSAIDMGAGAGAFARSVDLLLVLREHEDPRLTVVEAEARYFAKPEPVCLAWDFPRWHIDPYGNATLLKGAKGGNRKAEATPKQAWTAKQFAEAFVTSEPVEKKLVLAKVDEPFDGIHDLMER